VDRGSGVVVSSRLRVGAVLVALLSVVLAMGGAAEAQPPPTQPGGAPAGQPGGQPTGPPEGEEGPVDPTISEAAVDTLLLETAVIVELGGFGPSPNEVLREIADGVAPQTNPAGLTLIELLERADQTAVGLLPQIPGPSLEVTQTLGSLGTANLDAVADGAAVSLTADTYLLALDDLIARGGRPPIDATGAPLPPAERTVDVALITRRLGSFSYTPVLGTTSTPTTAGSGAGDASPTTVASTPEAAPASSGDSSSGPLIIALVLIGIVLLVAAGWLVGRSRKAGSPEATEDLDEMLEITRQLTKAHAPDAVGELTVREAVRLTQAAAGAFVVRDGDTLIVGSQHPDGVLVSDHLSEGVLGRVVDTGQPISTISATEQAVANLPASLLAAPVISRGSVAAVILVLRRNDRPFERSDTDTLMRLAPVVASAFESAQQRGRLEEMTLVDALTSLGNRRAFDRDIVANLDSSRAQGNACSMVMIDVDHFKRFNDDYGHAAGDAVLRNVGRVLAETVRPDDRAYRYGGEEFAVLLPSTTEDEAYAIAERLRAAIEAMPPADLVTDGTTVTVSLGVASTSDTDAPSLQRRADEALYRAKDEGRNREVTAVPSS
jgi:diguanylate cyclase (GGDEF)-like protein